MTKTKLFLAILSAGLLALGGMATAVAAEDEDDSPSDRREKAQERRHDLQNRSADGNHSADARERHERMREAHDAWQDCKEDHRNSSLNESMQRYCMAEKGFFLNATHAKREGRALYGAIAALERQIGRLELREMALEEKLASGNFTGNQTAESVQAAIEKIDAAQERLAEKLEALKARLDALHEKWQTVRDHVKERRHGDDDEDDEEDDDESSSGSSSSASESASSSSSASSTSGSP